MTKTIERQVVKSVVDLTQIPCPACGQTDRWDGMETRHAEANNPELIVWCDCGRGELNIVVE